MKLKNKLTQLHKMYQNVGYHKKFVGLFLLIIITAIIEIITVPYLVKQILDVEIPKQNIKGLMIFVGIQIFIILLQCYMVFEHCKMRCNLSRWIKGDLRNRVFEKLQKVKAKFFDENESGMVLQFLQDDTEKAGQLFPIIITEMFVMGLIRFSILIIFFMFVNLKIALIIVTLYFIGFLITLLWNRKTMAKIEEIRKINMNIYTSINEGIQSFLTIKTLGIMNQKIRDLETKLEKYNSESSKLEKIISTYNGIFSFITSFSVIAIIYIGGMDVLQGIMTYAEVMLMIDYAGYLEFEFNWFIKHLTDFNQSFYAHSKILELLEQTEEEDLKKGEKLTEKITSIEFDKVSFSYNHTQKNIRNFSLQVEENEKIALIGKTGARKNNSYQFARKIV